MGVTFEKKRKIFHIFTKNFSYYIHVNKYNYLIHLYSGKYLSDISKERVSERYSERYAFLNDERKETMDEDYYFSFVASQFEVAPFGKGDKRNSPFIIEGKDNIPITNFLYKSYKIVKGLTNKDKFPLPYVKFKDNELITLVITLKDEYKDVYLELYYEISEKFDTLVRYSRIINKSNEDIRVKKLASFELDLPSSDYKILALKGTWGNDTEKEIIPLNHSLTKISDNHGGRGFYYNPAIALLKNDATLDSGEVYSFVNVYSSDFAFEIKVDEIDQTRIIGGYNDETFEYLLKEKEDIYSFKTIINYSANGLNGISHLLHDLIRKRIMPETKELQKDYILLNSWEGFYFDFNTEKIISLVDEAKKCGINLVVIDDGWFKNRNSDTTSLGDWEVDTNKIDLKKVIEHAKEIDMKIGLWVEPEMISPESFLFKEHSEYALIPPSYKYPTLFRHQLVLDLTNKEVRDYILDKLSKIFDEYDISYVKWDFNRYLTEAYSSFLEDERKKETTYRFILGTYDLLNRFVNKYPHILLETCSAGGGRFDAGMLFYSPQIWGSDETDIALRASIQYSKNIFYPLRSIGAHVSNRKIGSIQDKACLAMFGTYGYELDATKLNEEDKKQIVFFNSLFKEFHHIVEDGDYYAIYDPYDTNFVSWNVVSKNKKECLVYFMAYKKEQTKARFIKLKGLKKDKYYFNSLTNDIYKGDFYMNVGLNVSCPLDPYFSALFVIKEVDDVRATIYRKTKQVDGGKRDKLL